MLMYYYQVGKPKNALDYHEQSLEFAIKLGNEAEEKKILEEIELFKSA